MINSFSIHNKETQKKVAGGIGGKLQLKQIKNIIALAHSFYQLGLKHGLKHAKSLIDVQLLCDNEMDGTLLNNIGNRSIGN